LRASKPAAPPRELDPRTASYPSRPSVRVMSSPSKLRLMRIEHRNLRKYHPASSVHRCQKQKMPMVGGVSGTAPSSEIVSKRSVDPIMANTSAANRGTTHNATRWPNEKSFSELTLRFAIPLRPKPGLMGHSPSLHPTPSSLHPSYSAASAASPAGSPACRTSVCRRDRSATTATAGSRPRGPSALTTPRSASMAETATPAAGTS